jgi:hypothetical protein
LLFNFLANQARADPARRGRANSRAAPILCKSYVTGALSIDAEL